MQPIELEEYKAGKRLTPDFVVPDEEYLIRLLPHAELIDDSEDDEPDDDQGERIVKVKEVTLDSRPAEAFFEVLWVGGFKLEAACKDPGHLVTRTMILKVDGTLCAEEGGEEVWYISANKQPSGKAPSDSGNRKKRVPILA